MEDLVLGATQYHELAMRRVRSETSGVSWEIKKLKRGTIFRLTGRKLSSKDMPIPSTNIGLLRDWDNFPDYNEHERTK